MVVLENEELKIVINSKGAELCSLLDKNDQTEYIWQADPAVWAYHAPNLFPIVGGLINNTLYVDGRQYPLNRHGFARTSTFRIIHSAPNQAIFELRYNEETLKAYPYQFEFQIIYELIGRQLSIGYKVINLDHQGIYFSLGAHPAFNVPINNLGDLNDYYLEFECEEELYSHQLSASGFFNHQSTHIPTENRNLQLHASLFNQDALVFKNLKSRAVSLKSVNQDKQVSLKFPQFNYLGIWAKPNAPFICIEPWLGCADTEGESVNISQKEAIQHLEKGHVFEADFSISV